MRTIRLKQRIPNEPSLSGHFLHFHAQRSSPVLGDILASSLFFWARSAIYHSLRAAELSAGDEVLVPAYVCKSVPEAILAYGAKVKYFAVDRQGNPVFSDLQTSVGALSRAMVVVHYFGFPQPIAALMDFCQKRNLFLIEDCAHALQTELDGKFLGSFGDASIFSLRKFLPIFDGGALKLNRPTSGFAIPWEPESLPTTLRATKDFFDQIATSSANPVFRAYRDLAKLATTACKAFLPWMLKSEAVKVEKTAVGFNPKMVNHPMSRLSRMLCLHLDIRELVSRRRANYQFLHQSLSSVDGLHPIMPDLPAGVCPWVFPLFFRGMPDACRALRERGIPAVTWEAVRPSDLPLNLYPDADFLYANLVFLPVHQNLSKENLGEIVEAAKQVQRCATQAKAEVSVS